MALRSGIGSEEEEKMEAHAFPPLIAKVNWNRRSRFDIHV